MTEYAIITEEVSGGEGGGWRWVGGGGGGEAV